MRKRTLIVLVAAIVLLGAAGGTSWWQHRAAEQRDAAVRQSLVAGNAAAQAIFSYDYRSFDASVANAKAFVTGDFATEYAETTAALKPNAVSEQAIVRTSVSSTGVVSASADRVELLLFVNQYRRNANITGEKVDQNRVVLTLVRVGDEWKVSHAIAL
jgi:Mce-associated membrane protein